MHTTITIRLTDNVETNDKQVQGLPEPLLKLFGAKLDTITVPQFVGAAELKMAKEQNTKPEFEVEGKYFSFFEKERLKLRIKNKEELQKAIEDLEFQMKPVALLHPEILITYIDEEVEGFNTGNTPISSMTLGYQFGSQLVVRTFDSHAGMSTDPKKFKDTDKQFNVSDATAIQKSYKPYGLAVTGVSVSTEVSGDETSEHIQGFFNTKFKEVIETKFKTIVDNIVLAYAI